MLFWCHLAVGTAIGLVVLIMAITGVILAYQRQVLDWIAARHAVASPPADTGRLALDSLVARARAAAGDRRVGGLTVRADSRMPVAATLEDRSSLFLDPYTGAVLGTDAGPRGFFAAVERIHRSIAYQGRTRWETGTALTGAANLGFLFLILTGFVLWWPRTISRRAFGRVLAFARGARGKARDWNWHHVLGFWSAPALVVIVVGAAFISYDWPERLIERAYGLPPSEQTAGGGSGPERGSGGRGGDLPPLSLDSAWTRAMARVGRWHSVQLRFPEDGGQISMTVLHTGVLRPDERSSVSFTPDGAVRRQGYQDLDPARQVRGWMRFLHTGEALGIPGQTVAALVSAATALLVWTGLALAWRRLRGALRRAP
ncbi:MAG TPA: PepSY-associated TM helix domain-containing protein [Gemmatimonadales bacterium]|nr:PepSY-associated TM helix domain-containing protein [Gemmatimonadales bacterium]